MSVKTKLKNVVRRGAGAFASAADSELRNQRNVEIVLSAAMREQDALSAVHDPVAYVDFLRACIEPAHHTVTEIKAGGDSTDDAAKRFIALIEALRRESPPVDFSLAREIALIADENRALSDMRVLEHWAGDTGLCFSLSSSFGGKGRILYNVIRFMRSENCLELGTAFGMSALFILASLKTYSKSGRLATVEGFEQNFLMSSSLLKRRYKETVECHFGLTNTVLPGLADSLGAVDFLFHDAGHTREDYIRDFDHVCKSLIPGAVVIFDDIRWEDARFVPGGAHTYEGWRVVADNPRVRRAVEIDDSLGMLLMGS